VSDSINPLEWPEKWYCRNSACADFNKQVENAGTPENEFYVCPECDKPLNKVVEATIITKLGTNDSIA
jgi:uncharacterized protein with PIN domain